MLAILLCACATALAAGQTESLPEASEIESRILSARQKLERGELLIDVTETLLKATGRLPNAPVTFHVWFDGDRFRHDYYHTSLKGNPVREIRCRTKDKFAIAAFENNASEAQALTITDIAPNDRANPRNNVVDPRGLGMAGCPATGLLDRRMNELIGKNDRKDVLVTSQYWKGVESFVVQCTLSSGCRLTIQTVPSWDYNVVRIAGEIELQGKRLTQTLESDISFVKSSGVWFPSKCVSERREGDVLVERVVDKITVKSLNQRIDPVAFTLAGMNLKPGTPISTPPNLSDKYWDGQQIVERPLRKR